MLSRRLNRLKIIKRRKMPAGADGRQAFGERAVFVREADHLRAVDGCGHGAAHERDREAEPGPDARCQFSAAMSEHVRDFVPEAPTRFRARFAGGAAGGEEPRCVFAHGEAIPEERERAGVRDTFSLEWSHSKNFARRHANR